MSDTFYNIDADQLELLRRMLVSHAYRERLASERFRVAQQFAMNAQELEYFASVVSEEAAHYQACINVATKVGLSLDADVAARFRRLPPGIPEFNDRFDVLLAHAFNDRAGYFVLEGIVGSRVEPYALVAARVLADEEMHGDEGAELLRASWSDFRATMQPLLFRARIIAHLDAALRCLGRPFSQSDAYAVAWGLKTRHSADAIEVFLEYCNTVFTDLHEHALVAHLRARYADGVVPSEGVR